MIVHGSSVPYQITAVLSVVYKNMKSSIHSEINKHIMLTNLMQVLVQ